MTDEDTTTNNDEGTEGKGAEDTEGKGSAGTGSEDTENKGDAGSGEGDKGASNDDKGKGADDNNEPATPDVRKAADGEDVEVDDKGTVSMPFTAFEKRIKRAAKSMFKDIFGTDDPKELKRIVASGKNAQDTLDKAKRSQMSEMEKIKADNEKLQANLDAAQATLDEREEDQLADKGEKIVNGIAAKHIDDAYIEDAVAVYQRKLSKMDDDELDDLTEADIKAHFKQYAEKKPAMARKATDKKKVKEPANNGPGNRNRPDSGKGGDTSKTPRPGRSNSMTKREWEDYKREKGLNF